MSNKLDRTALDYATNGQAFFSIVTTGSGTTHRGATLWNPAGSGVLGIILRWWTLERNDLQQQKYYKIIADEGGTVANYTNANFGSSAVALCEPQDTPDSTLVGATDFGTNTWPRQESGISVEIDLTCPIILAPGTGFMNYHSDGKAEHGIYWAEVPE